MTTVDKQSKAGRSTARVGNGDRAVVVEASLATTVVATALEPKLPPYRGD